MKYFFPSYFLILILLGCNQAPEPTLKSIPEGSSVEAISLLGDSLRTPVLSDSLQAVYIKNLVDANEAYKTDSTNVENIIWFGRRLGYLGYYQKAVNVFSDGITAYENEPRLYRHRGHRYITLRAFELAVNDFEHAGNLITGKEDIIEQDGLPNALSMPRSTLHTNIWYHLGLAYYLTGDFQNAQNAYQKCIKASTNDDMLVAATYWYYMTLKRNGQDELAGKILSPIHSEMDVVENDSYLKLLLVFKAEFDPQLLLDEDSDELSSATVGYGIGNWHYINGRKERAQSIWKQVYASNNWASFGYIASEAELARIHE